MKLFKYCCAAVAFSYLVSAFLPMHLNVAQHSGAAKSTPEWLARAIPFADFLLLGTIFYGLQRPRPIFWKIIPVLMIIYLLSVVIPPLWTLISRSLPWVPFIFIIVLFFVGALFFLVWWRNQKSYFTL
jgi:hypothetical protein